MALRPQISREDATLKAYLISNSPAFAEVNELRERVSLKHPTKQLRSLPDTNDIPPKGWNSPKGDELYRKKYERADQNIRRKDQEQVYYGLYRRIARELQEVTCAFNLPQGGNLTGLNLCMAPGGYTKVC